MTRIDDVTATITGALNDHDREVMGVCNTGRNARRATMVARALDADGHLMPDLQIIRTHAELEALDPDSIVQPPLNEHSEWPRVMSAESLQWAMRTWDATFLPAVVVATGEHVRACREALEGETT